MLEDKLDNYTFLLPQTKMQDLEVEDKFDKIRCISGMALYRSRYLDVPGS